MMELPKGWVFAKLNELVSQNGLFCDGDWVESKDQDPHGDIRLIQLADIGDGRFIDKSNRFLTKEKAVQLRCTYLEKGDILVARMPDPLGRATIFPLDGDERYVTVVDVAIIRPGNEFVLNKYCCYMINALTTRNIIAALQSGTTRKRIARTKLETIEIPLPPLAEQHRIVAKIDALFSKLDKGVEMLQTIRQQLRTYRQAVLKWAFEGKDLAYKPLNAVVDSIFDGPFGSNLKTADYTDSGVRVVRLENVKPLYFFDEKKSYISNEKYNLLLRNTVRFPDLIMSTFISGEIKVCIVPNKIDKAINKADCVCIRTGKILDSKLLMYYLSTKQVFNNFFTQIHGATRPRVNTTQIKQILVPVLNDSEKTDIIAEIESRLSVCDKLEALVDENLLKAQALRQSILKKAFAGQLVPQDPSDEPAEKLLKRIKALKESTATIKPARRKKNG